MSPGIPKEQTYKKTPADQNVPNNHKVPTNHKIPKSYLAPSDCPCPQMATGSGTDAFKNYV